ncbi:hypothetical protein LSAT2_011730 [Lamellibrachia satsuma]|nr:hypothetical protein LSAT2_011730 [Lamellibrachia satsuma]
MNFLTIFALATCFVTLVCVTSAQMVPGPDMLFYPFKLEFKGGRLHFYCTYIDGTFVRRVNIGQSLSWRRLNGRCVRCLKCDSSGMPCESTRVLAGRSITARVALSVSLKSIDSNKRTGGRGSSGHRKKLISEESLARAREASKMNSLTVFVLAASVMTTVAFPAVKELVDHERTIYPFKFEINDGVRFNFCLYTHRYFNLKLEVGVSIPWLTLNGRCVRCDKCTTLGMSCEYSPKKRAITPRLFWIHFWGERRTEQCVSEEEPHRPVSELYLLSSVTSETRVIKPLLDRCNNIVKELENSEEVEPITMALERGGYPHCTTTKMEEQQSKK